MGVIKHIRQHDEKECGAVCLCIISYYFGKKHSLRFMRDITHTGQHGVTLEGIVEGAHMIGIKADGYEATVQELSEYLLSHSIPVIAHLNSNHFVVVYSARKGKLYIADPAVGKYSISPEQFAEHWSGYLLLFEDIGIDADIKEDSIDYDFLIDILKTNKKRIANVILLSCFILCMTVCSAYLFQILLDYIENAGYYKISDSANIFIKLLAYAANGSIYKLFLFMLFMTVTMVVVVYIKRRMEASLSRDIDIAFMKEYANKLFVTKISELAKHTTGDYISRVYDLTSIREMISGSLISFILNVVLFVLGCILLFKTSVVLFLIAIATIILYCVLALVLRRPYEWLYYTVMNSDARIQTYLKESIQGIELIKANNYEHIVNSNLMVKFKQYVDKAYRKNLIAIYESVGSIIIDRTSNLFIIFTGFGLVLQNKITLGELMSFYMLFSLLIDSSSQLLALQFDLQSGLASLNRINDVRMLIEEPKGNKEVSVITEIRLDRVSFSYFGRRLLFKDISFTLRDKMKVVLVGKNGSGKSTLLRIIMGMEKASSGFVYFNGLDIDTLDLISLRGRMAFVAQNTFLYADTLIYNITLGDNYSIQEIRDACEFAGIQDFIDQSPQGLNMFIEENAINLSSGQKQSIALARAIIRKPELMILDEATSNMDAEKEAEVVERLMNLSIPCIFVSHNKMIIERADVVVELGKAEE